MEEFPALNPIPKYPVRVDARTNEVKVKLNTLSPVDVFTDQSWTALCRRKPSNMETVAIIGSGIIVFSVMVTFLNIISKNIL